MKKILLSTIVLIAFAFSIILFDLSCKKTSQAQNLATTTPAQQGKIIYLKNFYGSGTQDYDYGQIWTANYDGTGAQQISITLPANMVIALVAPKVSPNGKTLFFNAFLTSNNADSGNWNIYACNIDGSNVHQVATDASKSVTIAAAY